MRQYVGKMHVETGGGEFAFGMNGDDDGSR
jgi:hypothetical protein